MNYISLDNLTKYHSKFKDYADAKYTLARDYGWKQTEKAGAVTCWPVGESRMKPVVEFLFKETLPSGTKGAGNPSTISGISSVKVTRCGKNLIKLPFFTNCESTEINGITFTLDQTSGIITANGTATADARLYFVGASSEIKLIPGKTYYMSGCPSGGSVSTYYIGASRYTLNNTYLSSLTSDIGSGTQWTTDSTCYFVASAIVKSGTTVSNLVFKPRLEEDPTATAFEPYAGADFTVPLPSTFYGGTLDVASGRLTVTHRMVEADSLTLDISNYPAYLPLECTDTFGRTITSIGNILALTGSTGGKIVYKLANPYTVQIDPVAITALPQVDKYTPRINTLYTDAENITVGYIKSPIRDEYEKVQAIIANGGTI